MFPVTWWIFAGIAGLLVVTTLTISEIVGKVRAKFQSTTKLRSFEIKKLIKNGDYVKVDLNLRGKNQEDLGNEMITVKADSIDSEVKVGKVVTLENYC